MKDDAGNREGRRDERRADNGEARAARAEARPGEGGEAREREGRDREPREGRGEGREGWREGREGREGGRDARRRGRFRGRGRRKVCRFCADKALRIDYKWSDLLEDFVSERGRIVPSRTTGTCARHQRRLKAAIKQARNVALLPYARA